MNTIPTPMLNDAQQILVSAVAHQIERMSKEEVQALVAKVHAELQAENDALKNRVSALDAKAMEHAQLIEKLEADKLRLYYKIADLSFDREEFEKNFDPNDYIVPVEDMLANARRRLQEP